jgi:glycosyltransferase involved in cell wall biosynthesis
MFNNREIHFKKTNWASYSLSKFIYPTADKIIAVTKRTQELLETRKLLHGRVVLLRNGVNVDFVPRRHMAKDPFKFISVGRVCAEKNHQALITVSQTIPSRYRFNIKIVGDGPLLENMRESLSKHKLDHRLCLVGFKRDISDLLEDADCFLLPSLWELCPISILEAMSKGLPVIATDVGAIRDMVEDGKTGLIVRPGDRTALAAAMMKMMDNRQAAIRMGREGFRKLERQFSIDAVAARLIGIYEEILNR